jgi:hypothetical protein
MHTCKTLHDRWVTTRRRTAQENARPGISESRVACTFRIAHWSQPPPSSHSLMLFLGNIFYIGLLLINAVAVLSEDRFLARSACLFVMSHLTPMHTSFFLHILQSDGRPFLHPTTSGFNKIMIKAADMEILCRKST